LAEAYVKKDKMIMQENEKKKASEKGWFGGWFNASAVDEV
jgi:subtilase family serine protease